jgi:hypothetical protein
MASSIAEVGRVTVSLRKSIIEFVVFDCKGSVWKGKLSFFHYLNFGLENDIRKQKEAE